MSACVFFLAAVVRDRAAFAKRISPDNTVCALIDPVLRDAPLPLTVHNTSGLKGAETLYQPDSVNDRFRLVVSSSLLSIRREKGVRLIGDFLGDGLRAVQ